MRDMFLAVSTPSLKLGPMRCLVTCLIVVSVTACSLLPKIPDASALDSLGVKLRQATALPTGDQIARYVPKERECPIGYCAG